MMIILFKLLNNLSLLFVGCSVEMLHRTHVYLAETTTKHKAEYVDSFAGAEKLHHHVTKREFRCEDRLPLCGAHQH